MSFKSQKGFALVKLTIKVIILLLILGVTTFVVVQKNGVLDRGIQNTENELVENNINISKLEL